MSRIVSVFSTSAPCISLAMAATDAMSLAVRICSRAARSLSCAVASRLSAMAPRLSWLRLSNFPISVPPSTS
ncbi:hypothetical protein B5F33_10490 [Collinsella sp. An2]|nr:hypothetical protein B5F33_10490 [Collinsella sp. An2]